MYLYGIVLKRLDLNDLARDALLASIQLEPCHWGAWLELSGHITDRHEVDNLPLPEHWIRHFFLAHAYLELHLNNDALIIYFGLENGGLKEAIYIKAQVLQTTCILKPSLVIAVLLASVGALQLLDDGHGLVGRVLGQRADLWAPRVPLASWVRPALLLGRVA